MEKKSHKISFSSKSKPHKRTDLLITASINIYQTKKEKKSIPLVKNPPAPPPPPPPPPTAFNYLPFLSIFMTPLCLNFKNKNPSLKFRGGGGGLKTNRVWGHFGPFLHFEPPNNPKNQNFEKNGKNAQRFIILHLCTPKWGSYDVQLLRYGATIDKIFVILDQFLPFYPSNSPENQNYGKMKKTLEIWPFYTCAL